jgi:hypothetical protein
LNSYLPVKLIDANICVLVLLIVMSGPDTSRFILCYRMLLRDLHLVCKICHVLKCRSLCDLCLVRTVAFGGGSNSYCDLLLVIER